MQKSDSSFFNTSGTHCLDESVPTGLQLPPKLFEVVDFTVKGDPGVPVGAGHGLSSSGQIDDGQPSMAEGRQRVHQDSLSVRPPMGKDVSHPPDKGGVTDRGIYVNDTCDSAHWRFSPQTTFVGEAGRKALRSSRLYELDRLASQANHLLDLAERNRDSRASLFGPLD
jgi:hypothetical protein